MTRYKHTQIGYLIIGGLFGLAIFLAITGIVAPAGRDGLLISAIIEVILLICASVFSKLTIKIDGESLEASFATGLIRKKVPLAEIAEFEPVRIPRVARLGNSPNVVRALQCFWFGCCGDQAAQRPKVRAGH